MPNFIFLKGIMKGYWDDPEKTAEAIDEHGVRINFLNFNFIHVNISELVNNLVY